MKIVEVKDRTIDSAALNGQIVAFDNNSYTIRFRLAKMFNDETDLSAYVWYLIFVNSEEQGDVVALSAPVADGDNHFYIDWQPGGIFTQTGGGCYLQLFGINGENKWHTEQCYVLIHKALTADSTSPLSPSILLTYLTTFQTLETNAANSARAALESQNAAATSEENAYLYKQQTDQNKAQVATDKGIVAAAKEDVLAYKEAVLAYKEAALESKNAAATSEQNAYLYKQQTDQNRAQVATDKGIVAAAKEDVLAYKEAVLAYKEAALESKNAAATSEQNAYLYKQQTDQNKAQVATDKGIVATDKEAVLAYKEAALQALAEMRILVTEAEAAAAAIGSPVAAIESNQYVVGMMVNRGRTFLSVEQLSS